MMQFIIHTGCLRTYGVAFVCQGAECFMMVMARICISGRLPASSLSSSRMKIDTALWKHVRGVPNPGGQRAQRGGCLLRGLICTRWGTGEMLRLCGGIPSRGTDPLACLSKYWGWLCSGGCSGQRPTPSWWGDNPNRERIQHPLPGHKGILVGKAASSPGAGGAGKRHKAEPGQSQLK